MELDNRTLMVAVAVSSALCAAARFLLKAMHPTMPGLGHWAWASVLGTCAALVFTQTVLPERLSASMAQVLILLGFLVSWDGYRRFLGRKPVPLAALSLGLIAAFLAIGMVVDSQTHRSLAGALPVALLCGLIARELLDPRTPRRLALRATAWVYALNALFFLARAGILLARGDQPLVLQWDAATAVALLWLLGMVVATTLGMVLMTGERLQEELDHQISRDPLTGALNRRAFALMAEKAVAHCRRQGRPLALLVMDLDHFKQINDRHGHAMGDLYLCRFVAIAGRILRGEDIVCRFGGEEFVALLPETSVAQAWAAAERLRAAFAEEVAADPTLPFAATVSIGIGQMAAGESLEDLMRRTDAGLYRAKHNGRDRCECAVEFVEPAGADARPVTRHGNFADSH